MKYKNRFFFQFNKLNNLVMWTDLSIQTEFMSSSFRVLSNIFTNKFLYVVTNKRQ